MKAIRLGIVFAAVLSVAASLHAATKYKPCSLLTSAEVKAAAGAEVKGTQEGDVVIRDGPMKGETMTNCTWMIGNAPVILSLQRAPRTAQERTGSYSLLESTDKTLRSQGWKVQPSKIGGTECRTYVAPAATGLPPFAACVGEAKGFGFAIFLNGKAPSAQQAKALLDKAVARLP